MKTSDTLINQLTPFVFNNKQVLSRSQFRTIVENCINPTIEYKDELLKSSLDFYNNGSCKVRGITFRKGINENSFFELINKNISNP